MPRDDDEYGLNEEEIDADAEGEAEDEEELDEETRAVVEKHAARARDEVETRVRAALQEQGFDLAADGTPVIRDAQKASGFVGVRPAPPAASQPAASAPVASDAEPDEEMPDPYDTEQFQRYLKRRDESVAQRATAAALEEFKRLSQPTSNLTLDIAAREATERAKRLLPEYGLQRLVEHPQFDEEYRRLLLSVDPQFWSEDEALATYGSMLIPKLHQKGQPSRDESGRFTSDAAVRAAAHREMQQPNQFADGSRGVPGSQPTLEERALAEQLGHSVGVVRALSGRSVTIEDYERAKAAEKKKVR